MIIYDQDTHRYYVGGTEVPSVTTVIKAAGFMGGYDPRNILPMEYGTKVHTAVEANIKTGAETAEDVFIQIGLDGFRKFRRDLAPVFEATECRVHHALYGYAGTLDFAAEMGGGKWIVDVKTGAKAPWHIIQLAAYQQAYAPKAKCAALYLDAVEPGYSLSPYGKSDLRAAFAVFLNALNIYKWRKNNGL